MSLYYIKTKKTLLKILLFHRENNRIFLHFKLLSCTIIDGVKTKKFTPNWMLRLVLLLEEVLSLKIGEENINQIGGKQKWQLFQ